MPLSKKLTQGFDKKKKIEDGNGDKGAKGGWGVCASAASFAGMGGGAKRGWEGHSKLYRDGWEETTILA